MMQRTIGYLFALTAAAGVAHAQTISRISVSSSGAQAVGAAAAGSNNASVSDDGRFVVFSSTATNLIDGNTTNFSQVFIRDRALGTTNVISINGIFLGNDDSYSPKISGDGNFVVFETYSTNLGDVTDNNGSIDVVVWERATGLIRYASRASDGTLGNNNSSDTFGPSISADGRYIAFTSTASNLVPGGTGGATPQVYWHDMVTGATARVSVATGGAAANRLSTTPTISGDGRSVAFRSAATNLISGDTNAVNDIFVRRITTADGTGGSTIRVSLTSSGGQITGASSEPYISRDGNLVAFLCFGNVTGSSTTTAQVYLRNISAGTTTRITNPAGVSAAGGANSPVISADGNIIAYSSSDNTLLPGDTNSAEDVFLFNRTTGITRVVNINTSGTWSNNGAYAPALSASGDVVAFETSASDLVLDDTNGITDIFVSDSTPVILPCLSDRNSDGVVDGTDFVLFINSFAIGDVSIDPAADINGDFIIDGNDFVAFINAFALGC